MCSPNSWSHASTMMWSCSHAGDRTVPHRLINFEIKSDTDLTLIVCSSNTSYYFRRFVYFPQLSIPEFQCHCHWESQHALFIWFYLLKIQQACHESVPRGTDVFGNDWKRCSPRLGLCGCCCYSCQLIGTITSSRTKK